MLRIRLSRVGKKKQPSYRLVVADSRAPRDGAFVKIIGHYNPRSQPSTLVVKEEEAVEWLRRGAQPSDTVAKLLTRIGVMERAGRAPVVWDRKTPVKPKKPEEEAPVEAAAAEAPAEPEAAPEEQPKPKDTEAKTRKKAKTAAPEEPPEPQPAEGAQAKAQKKAVTIHVCGFIDPIMEMLVDTGAAAISFDAPSPLEKMLSVAAERTVIIGNVPTTVFLNEDRDAIYREVQKCREIAGDTNAYVLASGCEVPIPSSARSIEYFMEAAKQPRDL